MRLLIDELGPAQLAELEQRLQPGAASVVGFLAPGERVADIVARDEAACAARGIRPEQIGDRLETLVGRAQRRVNVAMRIEPGGDVVDNFLHGVVLETEGVRITGTHYRGFQDCPFSDEWCELSRYACADFELHDLRSLATLAFPGLIFHLARDHHFFEGAVAYRLDPDRAIDFLGLEPGVDYAPIYATETCWDEVSYSDESYEEVLRDEYLRVHVFPLEDAREILAIAPGVRLLWNGERCIVAATHEHVLDAPLVIAGTELPRQRVYPGTTVFEVGDNSYVR